MFERSTAEGGCADCHGVKPGRVQFPDHKTWATPVLDVGTDSREYDALGRTAHTGVLEGARIPVVVKPLKETDYIVNMLAAATLGSILQNGEASALVDPATQLQQLLKFHVPPSLQGLVGAFKSLQDIRDLSAAAAKPAYRRACWRASGPPRPICTMARCRLWPSC